jgi:uncharacterized protein YqgV (UPF0045/DUF77 family)
MKLDKKYWILIFIILFAVIVLIIGLNVKKDVTTIESSNGSNLPEVNIDSTDSDAINEYVEKLYKQYTSDGKSKLNYTTFTYNNIISMLITIDEYDEETGQFIKKYLTFNIDKSSGKFIEKEDFATLLGIDLDEILNIIQNKFQYYYQDELQKNYISNIDFDTYMKEIRGIEVLFENTYFAIENNTLVAYVNFYTLDSIDEGYFNSLENPHRILIKEL